MKIVIFLRKKNGDTPKRVVDFPLERHIPKQNHGNRLGFRRKKVTTTTVNTLEIVEDFACEAKFLHFLIFFIFRHFSFFFMFFIFLDFS